MKRISPTSFVFVLLFLGNLPSIIAQNPPQSPQSKGCFTSSTGLTDQGEYLYQSPSYCQETCYKQGKAVGATYNGSNCFCGDKLPPTDSKTSDSSCSKKCQGFGEQMCGGPNSYSVFLTGTNNNPGSVSGGSSSDKSSSSDDSESKDDSESSDDNSDTETSTAAAPKTQPKTTQKPTTAKSSAPQVVTKASTIVVTAAGGQTQAQTTVITTTETPKSKDSGPNTAGIAAGVVVGVVAICAIAGGIFFFMRHRKRKALEEEYRQNPAMGSYNNLKPTPSSAGSTSDSRLEPSVMMQRRHSDVSIADNQDYSRRILKVTNPDHS